MERKLKQTRDKEITHTLFLIDFQIEKISKHVTTTIK